jgi:hypothetical protein
MSPLRIGSVLHRVIVINFSDLAEANAGTCCRRRTLYRMVLGLPEPVGTATAAGTHDE